jgi:serine/threonine-protein kinase
MPPPPAPAPVRPGEILAGKYRVDRVLGVGGMGVVVAATHLQLGGQVALKFMLAEALAQPALGERFLREARAAVRLRSQHVAKILDVGTLEQGAPYIVMELLEGLDLAQLIAQRGRLPPEQVVDYILQACDALAEAHAIGIVHRDLKPANLFVTTTPSGAPFVKVLDFGISKIADENVSVTQTSAVFGSPAYMSPEQLRSTKGVDARTDIWALGIVLYESLCGHVPFQGESLTDIGIKIVVDPLPPLPPIPGAKPGLDQVIYACLEKDPARRPQSIAQLAAALQPHGSGAGTARVSPLSVPPPPRPPAQRWPIVVGVVATLGIAGAAVAVLGGGGKEGPPLATAVDATPRPHQVETVATAAAFDAAVAVVAVAAAPPDAAPAVAAAPPAPWSAPPLAPREVPAVFLAEWRKAENRAGCPVLVPTELGEAVGARPRRATFYGGWAVAYDRKGLPGTDSRGYDCATCGRSAFGVAGAGVEKDGTMPFPRTIEYADGSLVNFGLVGNTGPGHLAYLTLPDASCLYNVWSALSEEHLLQVIAGLRRVGSATE